MLCEVEGCTRPRHSNGQGGHYRYCGSHRSRLHRTGSLQVDVPFREFGRRCSIEDCEEPHKGRGYCRLHLVRLRKTGSPFGQLSRPRKPEVTYAGAHARVRAERGNAYDHPCSEWAYDHEDPEEHVAPEGLTFSLKVAHYRPMCLPCHRSFDHNYRKVG